MISILGWKFRNEIILQCAASKSKYNNSDAEKQVIKRLRLLLLISIR